MWPSSVGNFLYLQERLFSFTQSLPDVFSAAGILVLAELKLASQRTILKGNVSYSDILVICPGFHRGQDIGSCNVGEYPITANMLSGYVFRVENEATVHYLQRVGRTGYLTTVHVKEENDGEEWSSLGRKPLRSCIGSLLYLCSIMVTLEVLAFFFQNDFWGFVVLLLLITARLLNVTWVKNRCDSNWHGMKEPGVTGDLIILLSRDRWIRMKGLTDDLKAVTSGQWLRNPNPLEKAAGGCSVILVYLGVILAGNISKEGKMLLVLMLVVNSGLLALSNELLDSFYMKNRVLREDGSPQKYRRRLDLANQLIEESGRKDWALKLGMVNTTSSEDTKSAQPQVEV